MKICGLTFVLGGTFVTSMLSLALAPACFAQSIAVDPVMVTVPPGGDNAVVTLINRSSSQAAYQVRGFGWSQTAGAVVALHASSNIIASPPIGVIAPGKRQVVRILITKRPKSKEHAYRIVVDEIPPPSAPGTVRIAIRMSVPVFVEPSVRALPDIHWSLSRSGQEMVLSATNTGNAHADISDIRLKTRGTNIAVGKGQLPYVLPGVTRSWVVDYFGAAKSFILSAVTSEGKVSRSIGVKS